MFPAMRVVAFLCCAVLPVAFAGEIEVKPQEKPIDPANMDFSVKPWENFYQYANGGWLKNHPIPADYSSWGAFTELAERNNAALHRIMEEAAATKDAPKGSPTQMVGDFYASGMDEAAIEKAGIQPIEPELKRVAAIKNTSDLAAALARWMELGATAGFYFGSDQDAKDSESVIGICWQGGLGLPDRDYYLNDDEDSRNLRAAYVEHIAKMLALIGEEDPQAKARTILDFETRLAEASMSKVLCRDPDATYHKMTFDEVRKLMPGFDWGAFLAELKIDAPPEVNVAQPEFFSALSKAVQEVSLEDWKTYLRWHLVSAAAPYLGRAFVDESFDFYGRELTGVEELKPRWKRVMATVDDCIGEAVGQLYVRENFSSEAKKQALELVENLREALRDRIKELDWMSDETKQAALRKLDGFRVKIGYPDKWRDYSGLEINRDSYVENVFRANAFEFHRDLAKIGKPVDRDEWHMTPPTVNAYYNASMNEIVFPAGILQPPFFDPKADDAVNYGGIGSVIGHEMTHGFDDSGRKFDADGNLRNWWTEEDLRNFEARSQAIIDQFDGYTVIDGLNIDGRLTAGENIADLGGLKIAEAALRKSLEGKPEPPKIDGFDWRQRFFLSFAQVWRTNQRDEEMKLRLKTDPHSPPQYRVMGTLANLPEFFEAFGAPPDAKMKRRDDERVEIW